MGKKGGIWGFLRGLGRRGGSAGGALAGYVTVELREDPVDPVVEELPAPASSVPADGTAAPAEAALSEALAHCVNTYVRPAVARLGGDDSLIQHPTSRAVLAALAGYWLLAVSSSLILLVAALAAPALRSVRALESGDAARRRRWLRYWTVYAVVATVSIVSDRLQALLPGYWTAKTLLLLWCAAPYPWHGSDYVYYHLLVPGWRHLHDTLHELADSPGPGETEQ
ncbi:Receptor expression-enhancing protein 5 [Amphibalanus amphitrite]|uniref:Receptor expression-enhancing protein n=1 Tax=Amphibalanus amphitrite TaxID=1232801 RepID=A0A6A4WDU1_AMPAM|nr:Receptor expression-enhancing protein 5 [Amphibalanus amphitrite]